MFHFCSEVTSCLFVGNWWKGKVRFRLSLVCCFCFLLLSPALSVSCFIPPFLDAEVGEKICFPLPNFALSSSLPQVVILPKGASILSNSAEPENKRYKIVNETKTKSISTLYGASPTKQQKRRACALHLNYIVGSSRKGGAMTWVNAAVAPSTPSSFGCKEAVRSNHHPRKSSRPRWFR